MLHTLPLHADALHGQFSPDLIAPALTIDSGDRVSYASTLDVMWGTGQHPMEGNTRPRFERREGPRDDGPAMCGPVAVRGAEPGDMLELHIETLRPMRWGWTYAGPTGFNTAWMDRLAPDPRSALIRWEIDPDAGTATSQHGHRVQLAPFLGTIGLSPGAPGWHTGWHPRRTGGNMDCKVLVEGSRLFLPVEAPGGLASLGDAHARQGDGELGGSAIECRMEEVVVRYTVRRDLDVDGPHAETPEGWVTFGFDTDLHEAAAQATDLMAALLMVRLGVSKIEALALSSVVVDLRVTQVANGVCGVHAVLPHGALSTAA